MFIEKEKYATQNGRRNRCVVMIPRKQAHQRRKSHESSEQARRGHPCLDHYGLTNEREEAKSERSKTSTVSDGGVGERRP